MAQKWGVFEDVDVWGILHDEWRQRRTGVGDAGSAVEPASSMMQLL